MLPNIIYLVVTICSSTLLRSVATAPQPSNNFVTSTQAPSAPCGTKFARKLATSNIGHEFADSGDVPFVVQVTLEDEYGEIRAKCTGSLLSADWVLTSSDCGRTALFYDDSKPEVLHYNVSLGIDFDQHMVSKRTSFNVSRVVKLESTCNLVLLQLANPIELSEDVNTACLNRNHEFAKSETEVKNGNRTIKGIATGWSTYGDSVQEPILRLTPVNMAEKHCLGSVNDDQYLCVTYKPEMHYYLLPGSPVVTINNGVAQLSAIACANYTSSLVSFDYFYMQTYERLSKHVKTIDDVMNGRFIASGSTSRPSMRFETMTASLISISMFIVAKYM